MLRVLITVSGSSVGEACREARYVSSGLRSMFFRRCNSCRAVWAFVRRSDRLGSQSKAVAQAAAYKMRALSGSLIFVCLDDRGELRRRSRALPWAVGGDVSLRRVSHWKCCFCEALEVW